MSVNQSSGSLQIPNITVDDLKDFHTRHFQRAAPLEEDTLGFYPDDVKRTLTDEQIAIFRHSEVETLLRERRHREDAAMVADEDEAEEVKVEQNSKTSPALSEPPQKQIKVPFTQEIQYSGTEVRSGRNQKWTQRRMARAQDEAMAVDVDLDYG